MQHMLEKLDLHMNQTNQWRRIRNEIMEEFHNPQSIANQIAVNIMDMINSNDCNDKTITISKLEEEKDMKS